VKPGLLADLDDDLCFLREVGIARIVTLTMRPLPDAVAAAGFEVVHFPISDMGIPTPRACAGLVDRLVVDLAERPTVLHCRGGLGRTGTIAACCLVSLGQTPDEALFNVRKINPNYVQNQVQAGFIGHYAKWMNEQNPVSHG
jgi:atypical dual specificity phosphatase